MNKDKIICYDLNIKPDGADIDKILSAAEETNYLFYDSFHAVRLGSPKPYPYMLDNSPLTKILIDVSTEKGKAIYNKVIKKMENE